MKSKKKWKFKELIIMKNPGKRESASFSVRSMGVIGITPKRIMVNWVGNTRSVKGMADKITEEFLVEFICMEMSNIGDNATCWLDATGLCISRKFVFFMLMDKYYES